MRINYPRINAGRLRHSLVKRRAFSGAKEKIWPILDMVGEERLVWCIENGRPLLQQIAPQVFTKDEIGMAKKFKWAAEALSDDDVRDLFPAWVRAVAKNFGEIGENWLHTEMAFLKAQFGVEEGV